MLYIYAYFLLLVYLIFFSDIGVSDSPSGLNNINVIGTFKDLHMTNLNDLKSGSNHSSDNDFY